MLQKPAAVENHSLSNLPSVLGIDFGSTVCRGAFWNSAAAPEAFRSETRSHSFKRRWLAGQAEALTVAAENLKEIKALTDQLLKTPKLKASFSVPVLFDEARRRQFQQAAQQAGFEVLGLVPETAAAALAYGYLKNKKGIAAIYSFGGGFFEFAVVRFQPGEVEWLAGEGAAIGGEDMDRAVAKNLAKELGDSPGLLEEVEKARCALSHRGSYDFSKGRALSRFEIAKWTKEFVEQTAGICDSVTKKAGVGMDVISEIILTGGVTRMPFVQETVEKIFKKKGTSELNPDLAVVYGTLIDASIRSGQIQDWRLKL